MDERFSEYTTAQRCIGLVRSRRTATALIYASTNSGGPGKNRLVNVICATVRRTERPDFEKENIAVAILFILSRMKKEQE